MRLLSITKSSSLFNTRRGRDPGLLLKQSSRSESDSSAGSGRYLTADLRSDPSGARAGPIVSLADDHDVMREQFGGDERNCPNMC